MKKILAPLSFAAPVLLAACSTTTAQEPAPKLIGMANPASVYCQKIGGQSITQKDKDGAEVGYCKLPNGQTVEEWTLFRQANKR